MFEPAEVVKAIMADLETWASRSSLQAQPGAQQDAALPDEVMKIGKMQLNDPTMGTGKINYWCSCYDCRYFFGGCAYFRANPHTNMFIPPPPPYSYTGLVNNMLAAATKREEKRDEKRRQRKDNLDAALAFIKKDSVRKGHPWKKNLHQRMKRFGRH